MILTTNTDIAVDYNDVAAKKKAYPKTITGPQNIASGAVAIYKITEYNNEEGLTPADQTAHDNDKINIKWSFWVESTFMSGIGDNIVISERALISESTIDFTLQANKTRFKTEISSKAILEATAEIIEENGKKINTLTVKFSKWLDGKNVYIEPYRGKAEHDNSKPFVATTMVEAPPEITNIYWVSGIGNRIKSAGFNSNINLCIESLGLQQETIAISLHDHDDNNTDDLIKWNGNQDNLSYVVSARKSIIPYQVESQDSPAYAPALGDENDANLEVYVKVAYSGNESPDNLGEINFTSILSATPYFALRNETVVNNTPQVTYTPITTIFPGQTAYLVADVVNFSGPANFSVSENVPLLVPSGEKLPLIVDEDQNVEFPGTVTDGLIAVEVKFQELDSVIYNQWLQHFFPQDGSIHNSQLQLKILINQQEFTAASEFKLSAPYVEQKIYHDGFISNNNYIQLIIKKVKFTYTTAANIEYNFGLFNIFWAQRWFGRSKTPANNTKKVTSGGTTRYYIYDGSPGVNKAPLVKIFNTPIPNKTNRMFEYLDSNNTRIIRLSEDTAREYFNPVRVAAILGAIISTGYDDVVTNGSVGTDGTGFPSVSHINGNNVDFKYLRTDAKRPNIDMVGGVVYTNNADLDKDRQNTLMDAFHTYGFGVSQLNYSHTLTDGTMLNFCTEDEDHINHLHIQGFVPNYR